MSTSVIPKINALQILKKRSFVSKILEEKKQLSNVLSEFR